MILNGYCDKTKENCKIDVEVINVNSLEDANKNNVLIGRIKCEYASKLNCSGKNCSVLLENGYKN